MSEDIYAVEQEFDRVIRMVGYVASYARQAATSHAAQEQDVQALRNLAHNTMMKLLELQGDLEALKVEVARTR